jgi:N-acetylglutamate synthase-like GNAT family acetyltransferase
MSPVIERILEGLKLTKSKLYREYDPRYRDIRIPGVPGTLTILRDGPTLKIENLLIPNEEREKGHGTTIVAAVEDWARKNGIKTIFLDSIEDAVNFWRKLGYRPTGEEASEPDWTRMSKSLDSPVNTLLKEP